MCHLHDTRAFILTGSYVERHNNTDLHSRVTSVYEHMR